MSDIDAERGTRLRHGREMALNRFVFGLVTALYFILAGSRPALLIAIVVYLGFACAVFAWLRWRPGTALDTTLVCALIGDVGMISIGMHLDGADNAALFPLYLWMIQGNGFRLGIKALFGATLVAFGSFAAVIASTPYWRNQPALSISLLTALIVLPAYSSTLIRKLSRARLQAEEASRAKSMFLASISHELRTPLNAILGSVSLIEDTPLDEEQRSLFHAMRTGTQALLSLIGSILDFSRAEAGLMPLQDEPVDLPALMVEIRDLLATQARLKSLQLSIHIGADVPLRIRGDRKHLLEVLLNLAANAIKFTERGGVCLSVERVAPAAGAQDTEPRGSVPQVSGPATRLQFEVTDTGIGIAPEAQSHIFDVFSQADPTILDRYGGTGLGLAISRQLVTLMGGSIGLSSHPGQGSSFWFTIEAGADGDEAEIQPARALACVLLCDDPSLLETIGAALRAQGLDVRNAGNLRDAFDQSAGRRHGEILFFYRREPERSLTADCASMVELDPQTTMPRILLTRAVPNQQPTLLKRNFITAVAVPLHEDALARACRIAGLAATRVAAASERAAGAVAGDARPDRRALHILVADDNEINRRVVCKILERSGHRVSTVRDGNQALDAMETSPFDLVLMDVNMPGMNGLESTRLFRLSMPANPRLPILALTADATEAMERRCHEAGMDGCISKPVTPARLIAAIEEHVTENVPPATPRPAVTRIADHPRFQSPGRALDPDVVSELRALGGAAFVDELLLGFVNDARVLIERIDAAVTAQDMTGFRFEAHALCSAAANVGATALRESVTSQTICQATLASKGAVVVQRLRQEMARLERERGAEIVVPEQSSG